MLSVLTRAACFIGIILLGIFLKKIGTFRQEDFKVLSKVTLNVTLVATIITNLANQELNLKMFLITVIGFLFACLLMAVSWLVHIRRSREEIAFAVLNEAGVNVGNFCLPFVQNFLGPVSVLALSLFDVGNSIVCLGGSYAVATMIKSGNRHFSMFPILRAMSKSAPLMTYIIMTIISILRIPIPDFITQYTGMIAGANAFMVMFSIGIGFHLSVSAAQMKTIGKFLLIRYGIAIPLSVISYLFFPLPLEWRQALCLLFLGPIAAAAPVFTARLDGDYGLASELNSISILISIGLMVIALLLIL